MTQIVSMNPVAERARFAEKLSPRVADLRGKTLGLWWNRKYGGDLGLEHVGARLAQRFGLKLHWESHPFPAPKGAVEAMAAKADIVIGATGDCGSCTSWLIHDLVEIERRGVPAVGIVSQGFQDDARASALAFGMPDLPVVAVEQTLTNSTPDEITSMLDAVLEQFVQALTAAPQAAALQEQLPPTFAYDGSDWSQALENFQEDYLTRGWGDGFPLVPPTQERVQAMLAGTRHAPDKVVAVLEPGVTNATVQKIAVNAVMAGCRPEHLPVVLAAVEAMSDPAFLLRTVACSTGPQAPLLIVNGPIAQRIGMNAGRGALGPGLASRVNTVIGRAIRLVLMNVGHAYLGHLDLDTIGAPRKYSMCVAENEAQSPWLPLHVERGFEASQSTVTVLGVESEIEVMDFHNFRAEPLLRTFAGTATVAGPASVYANFRETGKRLDNILLVAPDHARVLAEGGFDREGIRQFMFQHARREWKWLANSQGDDTKNLRAVWKANMPKPDDLVPVVDRPEQFHVCVVGGVAGKSQYLTGVGSPVTRAIDPWTAA